MSKNTKIDEYINQSPVEARAKLKEMKEIIVSLVPEAQEAISYGLATFKLNGNLVHFGAFKNHIGFYPTPSAIEKFKAELLDYETSKGAIKLPINKPLPRELIKKIVDFRVAENLAKTKKPTT